MQAPERLLGKFIYSIGITTPIPCSHLPLVEEAWNHFRHLECSTGGIQEADTGLASHKIPVPTAAGERDFHWDFLWLQQSCRKRGDKGEEQAQREGTTTTKKCVCVPLLCPLTTPHSTKAPKQKPTEHIFPEVKILHVKWQEERYKEPQHTCILCYPPRELL